MPIGSDFVYPAPKTPAHLRDVLRTIRSQNSSTNEAVSAVETRAAALEAAVGAVTATFDSAATVGQVVFITGGGNAELANAGGLATSRALAVVSTSAAAGQPGAVLRRGRITSSDWSTVVGATGLTPGATYFLDTTNGRMATTPPSARGEVVVAIGAALSATAFDINIQPPVLL